MHFHTPRGWPIPAVPAAPPVPPDPMQTLVLANQARGLAIDAQTALPNWTGERLDLGWAISVLHRLANPLAPRAAEVFAGTTEGESASSRDHLSG